MKTRLILFNVQPHTLLVGQPGGFLTAKAFHQFAAKECGFTGISMPTGFVDINMAIASETYRDEFQASLHDCGLTDGLVRMEMHVDGQNVCVAPYRVKRTGHFVSPDPTADVKSIEAIANENIRKAIDASAAFGFKYLPGFCGGRGFAAAMAKWPAWPKHLPLWVTALLASKWEPLLEYAADRGVTITFEIGHPENDLLTGENFFDFYYMLSTKARNGVGVNADASHFLNIGINPMPHFIKAGETGCKFTNHYKWGASVDHGDGTASTYGGWKNWSEASSTFFTFATVGPDWIARDFHNFLRAATERQGDEFFDVVYEGECTIIKNPMQAMMVGAHNCKAAIAIANFLKLSGVAPHDLFLSNPPQSSPIVIIDAIGGKIDLETWAGGPFDKAFDSPLKPWELLEMTGSEITACRAILGEAGYEEASEV